MEIRNIPEDVKKDLIAVAYVCLNKEWSWNAASSYQFGEQTAIQMRKGGLKGVTLSFELVTEWINAFPISAYLCNDMDVRYTEESPSLKVEAKHKKEGWKRRNQDADDRKRIADELSKHSHPLDVDSNALYNIANGQVAPDDVNVPDAMRIGEQMVASYEKSLPEAFHGKISIPVKTMEKLKQGIKGGGDKTFFDLDAIFLCLLLVGQHRQLQLDTVFQHELCAVLSSLCDEYGCLRKSNKAVLVKCLGVPLREVQTPDMVIVDTQQLMYHITGSQAGNASVLVESMKHRLARYPPACDKLLVFDKYHDMSAKDHERMRWAGEESINYNLTINSPFPSRDAIMKIKYNKGQLSHVISSFHFGRKVKLESSSDGAYSHDEADVTMVASLLKEAGHGRVIRVLSDDTDVFVLLVYWVWKAQLSCSVQMKPWDGSIIDMNATCNELGPKCLKLLGMHALSGCDTVSYPFNKSKVAALNVLKAGNFPNVFDTLGEEGVSLDSVRETGRQFFAALHGQPSTVTMNEDRRRIYTRKKRKPIRIMALPSTDGNLDFHVMRAHLQMKLWKAADKQGPPNLDITKYGWTITFFLNCLFLLPGFAINSILDLSVAENTKPFTYDAQIELIANKVRRQLHLWGVLYICIRQPMHNPFKLLLYSFAVDYVLCNKYAAQFDSLSFQYEP